MARVIYSISVRERKTAGTRDSLGTLPWFFSLCCFHKSPGALGLWWADNGGFRAVWVRKQEFYLHVDNGEIKRTPGSLTCDHPELLGNKLKFCGFDSQTDVCCGKWITIMFVIKPAFLSRFTRHWSMAGLALMILHRSCWNLLLHDTFAFDCSVLELWMLTSWHSAIMILRS